MAKDLMTAVNMSTQNKADFIKNKVYYHGSRGGLSGAIQPISRNRCDFGRGFYMGVTPIQAKGLVVEDSAPYFYELVIREDVNSSSLTKKELSGDEWLYTVLACRERCTELLPYISHYKKALSNFDFVKGPIADDRMNEAIRSFEDRSLTDEGLRYCLSKIDYGQQLVAISQRACDSIQIITEREIFGQEADQAIAYCKEKREESRGIVKEAQWLFRDKGKYIDKIIKELS